MLDKGLDKPVLLVACPLFVTFFRDALFLLVDCIDRLRGWVRDLGQLSRFGDRKALHVDQMNKQQALLIGN